MKMYQSAARYLCSIWVSCTLTALPASADIARLLVKRESRGKVAYTNAVEKKKWMSENQELVHLWRNRQSRDIIPQLQVYLSHPRQDIRDSAVRMLGRLDSDRAYRVLSNVSGHTVARKQENEAAAISTKSALTLRMALARHKTRHLTGIQRIEAFGRLLGIQPAELVQLSHELNDSPTRPLAQTDGGMVFRELIELLYSSSKRGEDITAITSRLKLSGVEDVLLRGAKLPASGEAKIELDYLAARKVFILEDMELVGHVADLGPEVKDLILKKLEDIKRHPEDYRAGRGYYPVFVLAQYLNDKRAVPILRELRKDPDHWLHVYATIVGNDLEAGKPRYDLP